MGLLLRIINRVNIKNRTEVYKTTVSNLRLNSDNSKVAFAINQHSINVAYRDKKYRKAIFNADFVYPDGMPIVWFGK